MPFCSSGLGLLFPFCMVVSTSFSCKKLIINTGAAGTSSKSIFLQEKAVEATKQKKERGKT
jgi:hypothetical protein